MPSSAGARAAEPERAPRVAPRGAPVHTLPVPEAPASGRNFAARAAHAGRGGDGGSGPMCGARQGVALRVQIVDLDERDARLRGDIGDLRGVAARRHRDDEGGIPRTGGQRESSRLREGRAELG